MAKAKKSAPQPPEAVSVKHWILAIFLCWFPGLNLLIFVPLAFLSRDQTMRNFYKANIFIFLLTIVISLVGILLIAGPKVFDQIWELVNELQSFSQYQGNH